MREGDLPTEGVPVVHHEVDLAVADTAVLEDQSGRGWGPLHGADFVEGGFPAVRAGVHEAALGLCLRVAFAEGFRARFPQGWPVGRHGLAGKEARPRIEELKDVAGFFHGPEVVQQAEVRDGVEAGGARAQDGGESQFIGGVHGVARRDGLGFTQLEERAVVRIGFHRIDERVRDGPTGLEEPLLAGHPSGERLDERPPGHISIEVDLRIHAPAGKRQARRRVTEAVHLDAVDAFAVEVVGGQAQRRGRGFPESGQVAHGASCPRSGKAPGT